MNEKQLSKEELEFENYIRSVEANLDTENDNEEENFLLSENSTTIEKLKYELCKKLVSYKLQSGITLEEFSKRAKTNLKIAKNILYYHLDKFDLESLIIVSSNIFELEIGILKSRDKIFQAERSTL